MKRFLIICGILLTSFSSCKKEDMPRVCATCTEQISGLQAGDFCGPGPEVQLYVNKLKEEGEKLGQVWECDIH